MVLAWPAGRWLVAAAGAVLVGVGRYNGYRALSKRFLERWATGTADEAPRWGARLGIAGLLARMVVSG